MRSCSYSPFPSGAPVYLHLSHIPVHHSLLEDQHANGGVLRYQCQSKEREVYHLLAWENCNGSSDAISSDFQPIHDFVNALDFLRTRFYTEILKISHMDLNFSKLKALAVLVLQ